MDRLLMVLNASKSIDPIAIRNALIGVNANELSDTDAFGAKIRVLSKGRGHNWKIRITIGSEVITVIYNDSKDYPEVVIGEGVPESYDLPVRNNRIEANHAAKLTEKSLETLPNPIIDIEGLSEEEVNNIKTLLENNSILTFDIPGGLIIKSAISSTDIPGLNKYSSRIYYPSLADNTPTGYKPSPVAKIERLDRELDNDLPLANKNAVSIMSQTPVYINKTLTDSMPKVESESTETTNEVVNSITKKEFNNIRNAYTHEGISELADDPEFVSMFKNHDTKGMRDYLGLEDGESVGGAMKTLFGISLKDFGNIIKVQEDPMISLDGQEINVFKDNRFKNLSEAVLASDEYLKYNDVYDAKYNMFTNRGEDIIAEGSVNFQNNEAMRENLRFKETDPARVNQNTYETNMRISLGGALVEDGIVGSEKGILSDEELSQVASNYLRSGDFSKATPRVKNYLNSILNDTIDTGATVTLGSTLSGVVINSAITGNTKGLDQVNISVGHDKLESLNDPYETIGSGLINKLVAEGFERKEAHKLVKPSALTAMYSASDEDPIKLQRQALMDAISQKYGLTQAERIVDKILPDIQSTADNANDVLASTIKDDDILNLVNKGIINVYEAGGDGKPVRFTPETTEDLYRVAGMEIKNPAGESAQVTNAEDQVYTKGGKVVYEKDHHVVPYAEKSSIEDGDYKTSLNHRQMMDKLSAEISRTYDSYIMSYVVNKLHEQNIPVVTTNDSFTVPVYAMQKAKDLYSEAVNRIYEFTGSDIRVDARNNLTVE